MTNNLKTAVLLAGLGGLIVTLGGLIGGRGALVFSFFIALAMVGGSYWFSDKLAIKAAHARPLEDNDVPWLRATVAELAQQANIPMPKLYISPEMQPNAFATGRNPKHASVAVTEGILKVLDQEELRAVLAHELGHVKNRDILLTSVAAVFGTAISMIANFLPFSSSDRENSNPIITIALAITAPLAAGIMQMALSRSREFQADATGADIINDGEPLARALMKIDAYAQQVPMDIDPAQASAYIINPLSGFNMSNMFRTHPTTEDRVARLRTMRFQAQH